MNRVWITNGSTSIAPIINPLNAACDEGYLPTDIYLLDNPGIENVSGPATTMMKTIVTAHGGDEPSVTVESLEDELDFAGVVDYLKSGIEAAQEANAETAVDVTPGRKFWSIISFRAGFEYDVDHLYYTHVLSQDYYGEPFASIPRSAIDLIDFKEVF